jgi:hypothetical protein
MPQVASAELVARVAALLLSLLDMQNRLTQQLTLTMFCHDRMRMQALPHLITDGMTMRLASQIYSAAAALHARLACACTLLTRPLPALRTYTNAAAMRDVHSTVV